MGFLATRLKYPRKIDIRVTCKYEELEFKSILLQLNEFIFVMFGVI